MHRDNQPTFNTKNQRVANYKDFTQNIEKEKEELRDVQKGFRKNAKKVGQQEHKLKWNKVTNKMDDLTKIEVDDYVEEITEEVDLREDKTSQIIDAIEDSLNQGDLNRLKAINKGLPDGWNDNYLINTVTDWLSNK